jgi:hypothetical protein
MSRLDESREPRGVGRELAQKRQPLCRDLRRERGDPRRVAAGAAQARHEPELDGRIGDQEEDREAPGRSLRGDRSRRARERRDDCDAAGDQVSRHLRQLRLLPLCPAELDRDVLPLDKACVLQPFAEAGDAFRVGLGRAGVQKPDHRKTALLRGRAVRGDCRG